MNVECPECGHNFHVQTRARMGQGTQKQLKTLNKNKMILCDIFIEYSQNKMSARAVQSVLYTPAKITKRWRRGDKDEPTGGWNYHHVQANLSLLVGNNIISMTGAEDRFNGQEFRAQPVPKYWMTDNQQIRYTRVIKPSGGIL